LQRIKYKKHRGGLGLSILRAVVNGERKPAAGVLAGVCSVEHPLLEGYRAKMEQLLPEGRYLVVVAAAHSKGTLNSGNIPLQQYDTTYSYGKAGLLCHELSREIEDEGYRGVSVPVYMPMDMLGEGKGMRGEICWRRAGVAAGLGFFGKNGLLVTREYGPLVRLGGVLTDYPLEEHVAPDVMENGCGSCSKCLDSCPAGALEPFAINKRKCGDHVFAYGLRGFARFLDDVVTADEAGRQELLKGPAVREIWQNFMTGGYYYCWMCQTSCPYGK
jgi:epoxyqueuosine reductase QueG